VAISGKTVQAVSLDKMISPLSKNKILILVESQNPGLCDQMETTFALLNGIGYELADLFDEFLANRYLTVEAAISPENERAATELVNYLNTAQLSQAVKAYLFVNEALIRPVISSVSI
jgi:hypothetical protein